MLVPLITIIAFVAYNIPVDPVVLIAIIAFVASTLSGILRQNRAPESQYINAAITAVFMVVAAIASLYFAGNQLSWPAILTEIGVIMVGPGAALEGFLQVKVNTGIPLIDETAASLETRLPKTTSAYNSSPTPIQLKQSAQPPSDDHAG